MKLTELLGTLTIIMIVFKLLDIITISWAWVFGPLIATFILFLSLAVIIILFFPNHNHPFIEFVMNFLEHDIK